MKQINDNLVSVIIPVYNGELYLKQAIDSIIAQTYQTIEIIVVDDGSIDNSKKIVSSYPRIRYFFQENQGVAVARNRGIKEAKGEYIAFLDQDDLWTSNKLSLQLEYLLNNSQVDYVLGHQKLFLESGLEKPSWLNESYLHKETPAYLLAALLCKKNLFDKVGIFNSEFKYGNDSDWFLRAIDHGLTFKILPELILLKRIHQNNESYKIKEMTLEVLQYLRSSIQRKRQKQG